MPRYSFIVKTGSNGTNAETLLILEAVGGTSPIPGYAWILNKEGNAIEPGAMNEYVINTDGPIGGGDIGHVHTIHLHYGSSDDWWSFEYAILGIYDDPTAGPINEWEPRVLLKERGWYSWTNHGGPSAEDGRTVQLALSKKLTRSSATVEAVELDAIGIVPCGSIKTDS